MLAVFMLHSFGCDPNPLSKCPPQGLSFKCSKTFVKWMSIEHYCSCLSHTHTHTCQADKTIMRKVVLLFISVQCRFLRSGCIWQGFALVQEMPFPRFQSDGQGSRPGARESAGRQPHLLRINGPNKASAWYAYHGGWLLCPQIITESVVPGGVAWR